MVGTKLILVRCSPLVIIKHAHVCMDQMLGFNGPEMTVKKILVNPNDDAKGDDDRATNYKVIQVLDSQFH